MSIEMTETRAKTRPDVTTTNLGFERRRSPRYKAVQDHVWLGWWDGEQFQTLGAILDDISRTGASMVCPDGPDLGMDAWFCVVGPSLSGGARARVIGREPSEHHPGQIRLRLTFLPTCPEDVYQVALNMLPGSTVPGPKQASFIHA